MTESIILLGSTAASIGVLHTLLGPDHYLPFIAMSRAGNWSLKKTLTVTLLCGLGHVLSSAALGLVGVVFGIGVMRLERIEAVRADLAGWLLLAFGLVYLAWGVRRAVRNKPHTHVHVHADGTAHTHEHIHLDHHTHVHPTATPGDNAGRRAQTMTPWVLFTIFVFGPCEPLIPILMYPAAKDNLWGAAWVTAVFAMATLITMTTVVAVAYVGVGSSGLARLERYGHAVAGCMIAACGVAVQFGL